MPNILEHKNVLIVPLALFIKNNEKSAAEKFAAIFAKTAALLTSPEESANQEYFKKQQQQFNKKSIQEWLNPKFIADFNLGKKNKHEFISELLSLLKLPHTHSTDVEEAWDALIELDLESSSSFEALIKLIHQGKSIYFIGDTNELHAKKILNIFSYFPFSNLSFLENLPDPLSALPLAINQVVSRSGSESEGLTASAGRIYFCLSYAYKTLIEPSPGLLSQFFRLKQPPGLLTYLAQYLTDIGKTKDDILLVNPYQKAQAITQKLALETIAKEKFYDLFVTSNPTEMLTQSLGTDTASIPTPRPPLLVISEDEPQVSEECSINSARP